MKSKHKINLHFYANNEQSKKETKKNIQTQYHQKGINLDKEEKDSYT